MNAFRTAYVYIRGIFAGVLCETDEGYSFSYDEQYLSREDEEPDIAEDDETQDEEYGKAHYSLQNCDGRILSATRPSKGNRGCSDA